MYQEETMQPRKIKKVLTGRPATDGAGVRLVRVVGFHDTKDFDPFLMLDAFDSTNPDDYTRGFPFHPHRGIETVTYLIEGEIEHSDSLGNSGTIASGDCQWMTAGSGIIHREMPRPAKRMLGVQLWLNLPAKDKMTMPSYRDIRHESIPVIETDASIVRVVSGSYGDVSGPWNGEYVRMTSLDVEVLPGQTWNMPTDADATLFVYIVRGSADFGEGSPIGEKHAVLFHPGESVSVQAGETGIRFLLFSALPLRESIAWGGPVVMNTQEELERAFIEMDEETFVKNSDENSK